MNHRFLRNLLLPILFCIPLILSAQRPDEIIFKQPIILKAVKDVNDTIKEGAIVKLYSIPNYKYVDKKQLIPCLNLKGYRSPDEPFTINNAIEFKLFKNFEIQRVKDVDYEWNSFLLTNDFYPTLMDKGLQYELRNQLEEDNLDYLERLEKKGSIFKDDYFEDYLNSILSKIHTGTLNDGRPGNLTVKIFKKSEPNAFCLSNGTILISTGLLSTMESEDELVGILAHEAAHFVLDHQILNFNKQQDRKKRAEFWAGLAIAAAATTDLILANNNDNHTFGVLTYSAAMAAAIIAPEILDRLGVKYSKEQENEADWAARNISNALNYDREGITIALKRIRKHLISTGNYLALSGGDTHPNIDERIGNDFSPINSSKYTQLEYLKKVSFINSYNAKNELWNFAHFEKAMELADKNIKSGVATELDYIIKATIIRRTNSAKAKIEEALSLIQKAKTIAYTESLLIDKEEGITLLRLSRNLEAKKAFEVYLTNLLAYQKAVDTDNNNSNDSDSAITEEILWTKKMIFKSGHM